MADEEEESMSEGFSASEDEWKPVKNARGGGGESSDDDDSDFEEIPVTTADKSRKREPKGRSATKQTAAAIKRKPAGQSLRTKLYNKYRPPPKTFPSPGSGNNSPSASTSRTASKNSKAPNEASEHQHDASSSDSSVEDYLVNPAEIDFQSSFFNADARKENATSPAPNFDCNAGMGNLSDSGSEDNNESSTEEKPGNAFDFRHLLEKANSLERAKETIAKRAAATNAGAKAHGDRTAAMDVNSLLALGEQSQNHHAVEELEHAIPQRLMKTKSTRIKRRQARTRPHSTLVAGGAGGDTDDSDWEEVADDSGTADGNDDTAAKGNVSHSDGLEIHVEMPSRKRAHDRKQQDLEMAFRRQLNRDLKERQLQLHKTSLLCCFARTYLYNRLINDTGLWQDALKLLPSKNSYPPECGTELKYYKAFVTWFKTAIKLTNQNVYPDKVSKKKAQLKHALAKQLERREARCKQDMIFIFIILVRGMGMQCRLVVNMQPLPLKPAQADLLPIKLKPEAEKKDSVAAPAKQPKIEEDPEKCTTVAKPAKPKANLAKLKDKLNKSKETEQIKNETIEAKVKVKTTNTEAAAVSQKSNISTARAKGEGASKAIAASKMPPTTKSRLVEKNTARKDKSDSVPETSKASTSRNNSSGSLSEGAQATTSKGKANKCEAPLKLKKLKATATAKNAEVLTVPKIILLNGGEDTENATAAPDKRITRSRSKSPKVFISPTFLPVKDSGSLAPADRAKTSRASSKSPTNKVKISAAFMKSAQPTAGTSRVLRSRPKPNEVVNSTNDASTTKLNIPQFDGADDAVVQESKKSKRPQLKKLQTSRSKDDDSDEDFEPSPPKKPKPATVLPKAEQNLRNDRRVLSTDDESTAAVEATAKRKAKAVDMWIEVWSDVEQEWMCVDLFKGAINSIESIRKSGTPGFAYCFAFQNDLSIKDVTARYCQQWTSVHKQRVDKAWLHRAISQYYGPPTERDKLENQKLRSMHKEKPLPTTISEFKDHPLYALERHLLKFQAIYPPNAPTCGFIRGEPIYSRFCVHTLHSREIWLKQARTVKLGEQPYKVVKARPKWDKINQTVIKDQPLEIFGFWQTQDYEPPTAENGLVPRNAYGNVELFKECMLPKKTVHLRLPGLNRVCKKLGIDCANAVIGFDFHQGSCHPLLDGFVVCEEFADTVTDAWHQDQQEQDRKEQEKYEARVYGNWKKLIRGLLIRERLKKKYNF